MLSSSTKKSILSNVTLLSKIAAVSTASSANLAALIALFAIVITPVSAIVASPDITLSIHFDVPVSYNNIAPSPADVMFTSLPPARVEVVEAKERFPEPSVAITWLAEPSAVGSVKVTEEPRVSAALRPTKFVPLSESSMICKVAPAVEPLPTLKLAGVAEEPASISV